MPRDKSNEFMYNQEHEFCDEQFYHADEFNRDVEIGLHKRDSFEGGGEEEFIVADSKLKTGILSKKERRQTRQKQSGVIGKAAGSLKVGAITMAAVMSIATVTIAHEHIFPDGWQITTAPTCQVEGEHILVCADCERIVEREVMPIIGHIAGDWIVQTKADCSHEGVEIKLCTMCQLEIEKRQTGLGDHIIGSWITDAVKSCTVDGHRHRECTVCGAVMEEETVEASHTEVKDPAVAADCADYPQTCYSTSC